MFVTVNGVTLHVEMVGDGEPLLWLHGFLGAGDDWRFAFDQPPDGYRLIAPDLRGHGASTHPLDRFSFRDAAEDVAVLLRHLDVRRVKAIGVSGGGVVLLHLAEQMPELVASMVLVSAPPYFPEQAKAMQRQLSESMFTSTELDVMRRRHRGGTEQIRHLMAHGRAMADAIEDVNFTPTDLAEIRTPTLLVFGDRDPLYPVSLACQMFAALPLARLWVVPNAGHVPIFGAAAPRFVEATLAFLAAPTAHNP